MTQSLQIRIEQIGSWWCRLQHTSLLWPIDGEYACATCGRHYPVPWGIAETPRSTVEQFLPVASRSPLAH